MSAPHFVSRTIKWSLWKAREEHNVEQNKVNQGLNVFAFCQSWSKLMVTPKGAIFPCQWDFGTYCIVIQDSSFGIMESTVIDVFSLC